jgi:hypothetical protein
MGDPTEEAQNCQNLFKGFVSQDGAAQMYRELYDDSRRYPYEIEIRRPAKY